MGALKKKLDTQTIQFDFGPPGDDSAAKVAFSTQTPGGSIVLDAKEKERIKNAKNLARYHELKKDPVWLAERRARERKWRLDHIDAARDADNRAYHEKADEICKKRREDREKNPEKYRIRERKWFKKFIEKDEKNGGKYRAENREWARQYRKDHPDKELARIQRQKEDRQKHPDKYKGRYEKYRDSHPGRISAIAAKRRAAKKRTIVNPKMVDWFYELVHTSETIPCYYCKMVVPPKDRHVDHVIPLCQNGPHELGNLANSCSECNLEKSTRRISKWFRYGQQIFDF